LAIISAMKPAPAMNAIPASPLLPFCSVPTGIGYLLPCLITLVFPVLAVNKFHSHANQEASEEVHLSVTGSVARFRSAKQALTSATGLSGQCP
jgi:hypothetical protein